MIALAKTLSNIHLVLKYVLHFGLKANIPYITLFSTVLSLIITQNRFNWSRDSAVGIATGYGVDDRGVGVRVR
jgi:ABC-type antimicrobial peptide transport system permease subunit